MEIIVFFTFAGRNFVGLAFNVTSFWDFGAEGSLYEGSSTIYGLIVYDTFLFDHGLYIDSYLKYNFVQNDFQVIYDELSSSHPNFNGHGLIASIEVGKKFHLPVRTPNFDRSFYYFQPKGKLNLGILSSQNVEFRYIF